MRNYDFQENETEEIKELIRDLANIPSDLELETRTKKIERELKKMNQQEIEVQNLYDLLDRTICSRSEQIHIGNKDLFRAKTKGYI